MRTLLLGIAVIGFAGVGLVTLAGREKRESTRDRAPEHVIQRGEYLVKIMGCNDCHTPWKMGPQGPEPDMARFLSGHPEQIGPLPNVTAAAPFLWSAFGTNTAFSGPWGVSYTFNLTPEPNTVSASGPRRCSSARSAPAGTWACHVRSTRRCHGRRTGMRAMTI